MDLSFVTSIITDILLLPLQVALIPFDALLAQIPGVGVIPYSLTSVLSLIGTIPQTIVNLTGISPLLWNAMFLTLILYISSAPAIQILKRLWAWVRP